MLLVLPLTTCSEVAVSGSQNLVGIGCPGACFNQHVGLSNWATDHATHSPSFLLKWPTGKVSDRPTEHQTILLWANSMRRWSIAQLDSPPPPPQKNPQKFVYPLKSFLTLFFNYAQLLRYWLDNNNKYKSTNTKRKSLYMSWNNCLLYLFNLGQKQ